MANIEKGIRFEARLGKYRVWKHIAGKKVHLGSWKTYVEAHAALFGATKLIEKMTDPDFISESALRSHGMQGFDYIKTGNMDIHLNTPRKPIGARLKNTFALFKGQ